MTTERQTEFSFSKHFSGKTASTDAAEYLFAKIAEAKRNVKPGEKLIYGNHHCIPVEKGEYKVLLEMQIVPKGPEDEDEED